MVIILILVMIIIFLDRRSVAVQTEAQKTS